ncbi:peptidoglycan D,D-transpeptidase FtsI family protein [Marinimicrobium alkaliphilum]|uniref:peptidoglycan D,D-transpeptidase FtsI family protein n=1 Tax=Marinimicrobium alkaliphilum TaxID=2202654 RepID=UPI000DB901C2|nr:penicillin-binding transpeptidase domain-containing protein [Marinimicrobium alkaliphilum]
MKAPKRIPIARWRFYGVILVLAGLAGSLVWRVADLQVLPGNERGFTFLQGQGQARTLRTETINASRGVITDRNGEPLAVSTPVTTLWANPRELAETPQRWSELARALGWSNADLESRMGRFAGREFMYLQRHMTPHAADEILALNIPGVYSQREYRRFYPAGEVAAHLVGMTDIDDRGQEGIELAYDAWLAGENGARQVIKDRHGHTVREHQLLRSARPGNNLTLSIDLRLQYLAHRELRSAVHENRARAGSMVIMDAQTGEILAMVNQPVYNPNDRSNLRGDLLRNRALTDMFEPGSTVKPFAVMAALESGDYRYNSRFNTAPGHIRVGGHTLTDPVNYGDLDMAGVIAKSSQVAMAKMAMNMEPEVIRSMYYRLGLGQGTGTGFPGEGVGALPNYDRWRAIQKATYSFGYGISATTTQLAQAYGVLANGGIKRPVSLLRMDEPPAGQPVVNRELVSQINRMLEQAVTRDGTGHRARTDAYSVAGKTGTVHKVGLQGYDDDRYIASFAGYAPAENPRIVAVVVIDEPATEAYFGGQVAAPVFSRVAEGALRLLQEPPRQRDNYVEKLPPRRPIS